MKAYRVGPIKNDQIDRAYLLLQPVADGLALQAWQEFCRDFIERSPAGSDGERIVVAVDAASCVRGLAIIGIRKHPRHGLVLNVPILVTASAADDTGVAVDLLSYLKVAAQNERCGGLFLWNLTDDSWERRLRRDEFERSDHGVFMPLDR